MRIKPGDASADTNLLPRVAERSHPLNPIAARAVRKLRQQGHTIYACSQNFMEFWTVATRPLAVNGLGLTPLQAETELTNLEKLFPILPDDPAVYPEWRRLVTQAGVSGKPTPDARLMAFAVVYGLQNLLTFNGGDFLRFAPLTPSVAIVDPSTV